MIEETPKKTLTRKQQVFIDEYLKCFNGAEAARRAGYSDKTARQTASDLLAEDYISEQIQARLAEVHMSADEALEILAAHARGDIGKFADRLGQLDLQAAKEAGISRLIKKFKQKTVTKIGKSDTDEDVEIHDVEIELYDAQSAAEKILKIHGKFIDRQDITSGGDKITEIGIRHIDYRTGIADVESGSSADSEAPSQD